MAFTSHDVGIIHTSRSLSIWLKKFRSRSEKSRRLVHRPNGLRVHALLNASILTTEKELRRKQQERYNRWQQIQEQFQCKAKNCDENVSPIPKIDNKIENSCKHNDDDDIVDSMAAKRKRRKVIADLWRNELSDLDTFLQNINGISGSTKKYTDA